MVDLGHEPGLLLSTWAQLLLASVPLIAPRKELASQGMLRTHLRLTRVRLRLQGAQWDLGLLSCANWPNPAQKTWFLTYEMAH